MQLTKHTDYALRVLISLAVTERSTIREISDAYRISENHLMKVVHGLAKHGYVDTLRGKGGGIRLARAPKEIRIGAVVRDTEETLSVVECLANDYGGDCRLTPSCALKGVLKGAQRAFLDTLDRYTLEDLLPRRGAHARVSFVKPAERSAAS